MSFSQRRASPASTATRASMPDWPADGLTPVERSYLEVISYLASRHGPVISAQIARWKRVRPPSVVPVLQRLEQKQLISRTAVGAITLTDTGREIAEWIIRRHRLLERFLFDVLHVPWHEVHREATLLEPALSVALEERVVALVGAATTCPHGNPIPRRATAPSDDLPLTQATPGSWFVISRIDEEAGEDSCTLQLLWMRGLIPGTPLVRLADPTSGVALLRADRSITISRRVAGFIWGHSRVVVPQEGE
ncbi:MAG: metal-dependent transcriptional regulator [Roseiflexaceae bacterium]